MILSDETLKRMIADGDLVVEPLDEVQIQPASIDMTLGTHFLKVDEHSHTVLTLDQPTALEEIKKEEIVIPFLLAVTREFVKLPNDVTAFVEGRSSIGRIGLFIQNAGRRICQLVFAKMDRATQRPYRGKYQGQIKATGSRVFMDEEVQ